MDDDREGRSKLHLTYRTLEFRRAHRQLFASGGYSPLDALGDKRDHACAFERILEDEAELVVAPRLVVALTEGVERPPLGPEVWGDTWLALPQEHAGPHYRNLFTGEVLPVDEREGKPGLPLAAVLARFPVALLERVKD